MKGKFEENSLKRPSKILRFKSSDDSEKGFSRFSSEMVFELDSRRLPNPSMLCDNL